MSRELLRRLPRVDDLLRLPEVEDLLGRLPRTLVLEAVRAELDERRSDILGGSTDDGLVSADAVAAGAGRRVAARLAPSLSRVINATGVVLHTNLGRAPLDKEILAAASEAVAGYSNLEYELAARGRGSRYVHCAQLLRELTGAADSLVVNNNAAAVLLVLAALARGREVVVSRGELIEIGGSFRLPEVFGQSGARMVEVGTTNRTHLSDYAKAIGPDTAMLLKVHRSNFDVLGFTAEVSGAEVAALAADRGILAVEDLGSGCLVDLAPFGIASPAVSGQVAAGLDLVTFSGDKLLGGPQAGVIVGRGDLVDACRKHPLTRALRVDKLTLATLERTLLCYLDGSWQRRIPALQMLTAPSEALQARAERLADLLRARLRGLAEVSVGPCEDRVGGGASPLVILQGRAVRITLGDGSATAADEALRLGEPPVVCRVGAGDTLVFAVRTVPDERIADLASRIIGVLGR